MNYVSFLNTPVPTDVTVFRVLISIKGFGSATAQEICNSVGVLPNTPFKSMTYGQRKRIESFVLDKKGSFFETSLTRKVLGDIRKLVKIKHYRGQRLQKGLPARGQRTKTNAQTSRRVRSFKNLSLLRVVG